MGELNIEKKRADVAEYVRTMSDSTSREVRLSKIIEEAIEKNILDPEADIDPKDILRWFNAVFSASGSNDQS